MSFYDTSTYYNVSYEPISCPYRIPNSPSTSNITYLPNSVSWCAHHAFSDIKNCNMHIPCSTINTIALGTGFHIQTALLYIRCSVLPRESVSSRLSCSLEAVPKPPTIVLNEDIRPQGKTSHNTVQCDQPDLGIVHLHRDRLAAAADALGWRSLDCFNDDACALRLMNSTLERHIQDLEPLPAGTLETRKVQILVDKTGELKIKSSVIGVRTQTNNKRLLDHQWIPESLDEVVDTYLSRCEVYLDTQPTRPSTFTTHKTTHRCVYTSARERLNILPNIAPTVREVMLFNPYGEVMEASCSTVYFKRNGQWITPAAICGPTLGVTRRLAIEKGLCKQGTIEIKDLMEGEQIWLSNGVRGFFAGVLVTDQQTISRRADSEEVKVGRNGAGAGPEKGYGRALMDVNT